MSEQHQRAMRLFSALAAGVLFGFGLVVSQMIDPARVVGFLDVAGHWDPTLAFVMGGALLVAMPAFRWILKRPHPLYATGFSVPTRADLEPRLIGGSALFGIGWGLAGLCPGPAIVAMASFNPAIFFFVLSMLAGALVYDRLAGR